MASIVIRNLDEGTKKLLALQAKRHGRSMEAEARELIEAGTRSHVPNVGLALLQAAQSVGGFDDLPIPAREDVARAADFE
ncbi:toxin-antitoxin system [Microbacterium oryzae]|uniref:FitA-like ribbon-helix-helix domain-containing protein n=1 Tax=Microbacterium oryzae TaxID=743009 RepID=UPI0025AF7A13|nr:toxin-antitoxin system [Microbacterium oryzae]MDN3311016.1 toxin-antitoxin system [Microbacterium oryzae]